MNLQKSAAELEEECLQNLKVYIKENEDLYKFAEKLFDDRFFLHFVRGSKYDSERAFITLENFVNVRRSRFSYIFKSLRPSTTFLDHRIIRLCRNPDHMNRTISVIKEGTWNPEKLPFNEFLKIIALVCEEGWNLEGVDHNGIVIIFDMTDLNMCHLKALGVSETCKIIDIFWNCFPIKPKEIHVINEMYLFKVLFKLISPFLPTKFRNRTKFHGTSMKSLHKYLSPDLLPESLGGNLSEKEAFLDDELKEKILQKENYYESFADLL